MKNSVLTALRIGNFKAFGDAQEIPIRPITMIFGPNSAGKSTIIQSLILANEIQTVQRGRVAPEVDVHRTELGGGSVDLGGFKQFLHGADERSKVELGLQFALSEPTAGEAMLVGSYDMHVMVSAHLGLEESKGEFFEIKKQEQQEKFFSRLRDAIGDSAMEKARSRLKEGTGDPPEAEDGGFDPSDLPGAKGAEEPPAERSARVSVVSISLNAVELIRLSFQKVNSSGQSLMSLSGLHIRHPFVRQSVDSIKGGEIYTKLSEGMFFSDEEIGDHIVATAPQFRSAGLCVAELRSARDGFSDARSPGQVVPPALAYLCREFWQGIGIFLARVDEALFNVLRGIVYLGPLRAVPTRRFPGVNTENADWRSGGGGAWEELLRNENARDVANEWLNKLGLPHRLVLSATVTLDEIERALTAHFWKMTPEMPTPETLRESARRNLEQARKLEDRRVNERTDIDRLIDDVEEYNSDQYQSGIEDASRLTKAIQGEANPTPHLNLMDVNTGKHVSFRDVGTGTSQVLPILATALTSLRTVIAIEQPELHAHPKLQAELGDLIIESALGERGNCFILETHSEHLILRILAAVRTGRINPNELAVLYVMPSKNGSKVLEIRVDQDGDFIDRWPNGFFEESYNERMAGR